MPIENVSDTARWVAVYRAMESERRDAIFRDPFARRLAGAKGQEIVAERAPAPDRKVVDLFEALQASLDATKGRGRKRAKRAPASRRRKAS